jgi:hypothetical protein
VEAQAASERGHLVVVGHHGAAVAQARQVLRGEEREGRRRPQRAGAPPAVARARGLGGVLHDRHAESLERVDRRDVAEEVHGDEGRRARGDRRLDRLRRDAERRRIDVAEDRPRTGGHDGLGRRVEGERGQHDVVPRLHPHGAQRDRQSVRAVRDAHAVAHPEVLGERLLEGLHLRAQDVAPAPGDLCQLLGDPRLVLVERACEKRDGQGR